MSDSKKEKWVVRYQANGHTVELTPTIVQQYIVGSNAKINAQEYKLFTELCRVRRLNPLLKEVFCIKYDEKTPAQIVVSINVLISRAVKNPMYDGRETGIIVLDENNNLIYRDGCFYLPTDTIVGGWAKVYRKDWKYPTYCTVAFDEVAQKKRSGELNSNWRDKKATMVEKCAKARALRETFVEDLGGMYVADEFGEQEVEHTTKDTIEVEAEVIEQNEPTETIEVETEEQQTITLEDL